MRFAIYYAPAPDDPLTRKAARWLGRDAWGGAVPERAAVPGFAPGEVDARTSDARRYGFHATLKAPFRLAEGRTVAALGAALGDFAARTAPVAIAGLHVADLDGFLALVPPAPSPALDRLAEAVVRAFEPFRAPLTPDEIARRRPERLSPRQRAYLDEFGYPDVLEEFRFHMTLTDRLEEGGRARFKAHLDGLFPAGELSPFSIDRLALFREDGPGAPFAAEGEFVLGGA